MSGTAWSQDRDLVDHDGRTVIVNLAKDEITSAPDDDKDDWNDDSRGRRTDHHTPYSSR